MSLFDITAVLLTLSALFAYINHKYIKWPTTIALTAISIVFSLGLIALDGSSLPVFNYAERFLKNINFQDTLLKGLLSFLLFAGALHVNLNDLRKQKGTIALLATVSLMISIALIGMMSYFIFSLFGIQISFLYCLIFGAIISPTDPIAVLALLKKAGAPKSLQTSIAGESLFNDGVGVVIFTILVAMIGNADAISGSDIFLLFCKEALGGALIGLVFGYISYALLKSIDQYQVEVLITLALVTGGYSVAMHLHSSGPIAMVAAGLLIGNQGRAFAMSDKTRHNLDNFWELIDEILNAVLFVLIGLELVIISLKGVYLGIGLVMITVMLLARFIGVGSLISIIKFKKKFSPHVVKIMTWGGIRGGISIALALSLPVGPERESLLTITYVCVAFSVICQGLSFSKILKTLLK